MRIRRTIRNSLARLPAAWGAALGIGAFVSTGLLLALVLPPRPDPETEFRECARQCAPRFGQIVNDTNYPMSAKGQYRQVCECR